MSSDDGFEMLSTMGCMYSVVCEETVTETSPRMYFPIREVAVRLLFLFFFHFLHSIWANKKFIAAEWEASTESFRRSYT